MFNFGLLCLVQGQLQKACRLFEHIIHEEFKKAPRREQARTSQLLTNSLFNLMYARLIIIHHLLEQQGKPKKRQSYLAEKVIDTDEHGIREILVSTAELVQVLEFLQLSRLSFSLDAALIDFQKLVLLVKKLNKDYTSMCITKKLSGKFKDPLPPANAFFRLKLVDRVICSDDDAELADPNNFMVLRSAASKRKRRPGDSPRRDSP